MSYLEEIQNKLISEDKTIVLPESGDERIQQAAGMLVKDGVCSVMLVRKSTDENLPEALVNHEAVEVVTTTTDVRLNELTDLFYEKRKHKGITKEEAKKAVTNPLLFGALLVEKGDADGCVAGAATSTADVLRSAIYAIGLKPGSKVVSSIFLMNKDKTGELYAFGDCAVVPYPDAEQLASIASDAADSFNAITGKEPRVAMLSFSTKGSATHERVELVQEALKNVKTSRSELAIDGELQFDAALLPSIAVRKAPESKVAGMANVFVFPNLDAGNIGYKLTERLGGFTATGPIIQGLNKPMNDLSRGCSAEDVVNTVLVSLAMS